MTQIVLLDSAEVVMSVNGPTIAEAGLKYVKSASEERSVTANV